MKLSIFLLLSLFAYSSVQAGSQKKWEEINNPQPYATPAEIAQTEAAENFYKNQQQKMDKLTKEIKELKEQAANCAPVAEFCLKWLESYKYRSSDFQKSAESQMVKCMQIIHKIEAKETEYEKIKNQRY